MVRQSSRKGVQPKQENEDIVFMLSCIRSRQNALIFFLELFAMAASRKLTPEQYQIYKQEFLQKQKINSSQIRNIIEKAQILTFPQNQIKSFWIKLKSIIRVSLERARTLGMLSDTLELCYDNLLKLVENFYTAASPFKQYIQIQQLVKRRTIEALIATNHVIIQHPSQDFGKIRSETFLKGQLKGPQSLSYSPAKIHEKPMTSMQEAVAIRESTRIRRKQKVKSKVIDGKKIHFSVCRYEKNLADVMEMRIQYHLDKKKGPSDNVSVLYDTLFLKNIANHKTIAKYSYHSGKAMQKIMKLKRSHSQRRAISHSRIIKRGILEPAETLQAGKAGDSRLKLVRPRTTKGQLKGSSSKNERIQLMMKLV